MSRTTIVYLKLLLFILATASAQIAGPYDLVINKVAECTDAGTREFRIEVKAKSINSTTIQATGNTSLPYGISDKVHAVVRFHMVKKNGDLVKDIIAKNFGGICTALKTFVPDLGRDIFQNLAHANDCLKPGEYPLDGMYTFKMNVPTIIYGKYQVFVELQHYKTAVKIGCIYIEALFKPKKKEKSSKKKG